MSSGNDRIQLIRALEAGGDALIRAGDYEAARVLWAEALAMRSLAFRCNVDESAGLAEVVELHGYSRRTPCQ